MIGKLLGGKLVNWALSFVWWHLNNSSFGQRFICFYYEASHIHVILHLLLGECRPPWLRQIITPILTTVKMLILGGERLIWKVLGHYLHHDLVMLQLLCCFCSSIHHWMPKSPSKFNQFFTVPSRTTSIKFHPNLFMTFWVMFSTNKQTDRRTNTTENITSFREGGNHVVSHTSVKSNMNTVSFYKPLTLCSIFLTAIMVSICRWVWLHHENLLCL